MDDSRVGNIPVSEWTLLKALQTMVRDTGGQVRTAANWRVSASPEIAGPIAGDMR
jgi:hypothetical protein